MDSDFESQNHELPTQIQEQRTSVLLLDPLFQTIKDPIIVKHCDLLFDSLNKKQS